jgi:hypothetical protein
MMHGQHLFSGSGGGIFCCCLSSDFLIDMYETETGCTSTGFGTKESDLSIALLSKVLRFSLCSYSSSGILNNPSD